jgi:hypothetical protein
MNPFEVGATSPRHSTPSVDARRHENCTDVATMLSISLPEGSYMNLSRVISSSALVVFLSRHENIKIVF